MNNNKQEESPEDGRAYKQFQILFLMKVEEVMQLIRHRKLDFEEGFDQVWSFLSNDN